MKLRSFTFWLVALVVVLGSCAAPDSHPVSLYYYDPSLDQDASGNIQCSEAGLVPVQRGLPISLSEDELIEETISLLISGELTAAERAQGITTEFPLEGLVLTNATLRDGELTLSFEDPNFATSGGACRVTVLRAQVEATAKQFLDVVQVQFFPEELFQP